MRVSPETLYAEIGGQGPREPQLQQYLPSGLKEIGKHRGRKVHSDRIRWRGSIHDLPADVESRTTSLHGESESIGCSGLSGRNASGGAIQVSPCCKDFRNPLMRRRLKQNLGATRASDSCGNLGKLTGDRLRASGGIGRRAGFRCQCPKGCRGSSPLSRTVALWGLGIARGLSSPKGFHGFVDAKDIGNPIKGCRWQKPERFYRIDHSGDEQFPCG